MPPLPIGIGEVLVGKYRVDRILGAGGMGVVVAATHLELEQRVAVKFLHPEALGSPEAAARFVREARAAVKIRSEHVARVIDVGRLESGAPYMVMEYLEGGDLGQQLQHSGVLPVEDAIDYVLQACDAMAEAHAAGIVHRDLKPANLFLSRRLDGSGVVKVLDFGISKTAEKTEKSLTRTSTLMGSPFYMSPEQMRSARDVDHRTDVWSLGVILFELLGGQPPFKGESLPELVASIVMSPPLPLREMRPEISPELENALMRALEKDPTRRYQSVGELAGALLPFAPRRTRMTVERILKVTGAHAVPMLSEPPTPVTSPAAVANAATNAMTNAGAATHGSAIPAGTHGSWSETRSGSEKAPPTKKSSAGLWIAVAAAAILIVGGGVFALTRAAGNQSATAAAEKPAAPPAPTTSETKTVAPTPPANTAEKPAEPTVAVAPAVAPEVSVTPPATSAPAPVAAAQRAPVVRRSTTTKPVEKPTSAPVAAPAPAPAPKKDEKKRGLNIDLK